MDFNSTAPYEEIAERWTAGRVMPIVGVGVQLAFSGTDAFSRPVISTLATDLAGRLGVSADEPQLTDLSEVASYYAAVFGRAALRDRLRSILNRTAPPTPLHQLIARVALKMPQVVVVLHQNSALERAFDESRHPFDVIAHQEGRSLLWRPHGTSQPLVTRPEDLDIDLSSTSVIYKPFGTLDSTDSRWDSLIIIEEDVVDLMARFLQGSAIPPILRPSIAERGFLYLGLSLGSWANRTLLRILSGSSDQRRKKSWAVVQESPAMERAFWMRQGVPIYDAPLTRFAESMCRVLD